MLRYGHVTVILTNKHIGNANLFLSSLNHRIGGYFIIITIEFMKNSAYVYVVYMHDQDVVQRL